MKLKISKGDVMKGYISKALVIVFSLLTLGTAFAQPTQSRYSDKVLEQGLKVFPVYLKSDYQGIVESTIYNIVVLKSYFPNANYKDMADALNEVALNNANPSIRYKAHLASMYLTIGNNLKVVSVKSGFDHEKVFRQIADQLEKELLVSNE